MAAVRKTPTSNKPAKQQFAILSSRILNMMVINIVIIQKHYKQNITQPKHPFSEHGADYSKSLGGGIKKTAGGCFRLRVGYLGCKFKPERQVAGHKKSKIGNIIWFKIFKFRHKTKYGTGTEHLNDPNTGPSLNIKLALDHH